MEQFVLALNHYLTEIIPALALGFFLSGLIHEFVPQEWVKRKLGKVDVKSIFYATLTGTLLPICCWGALPVAVSFYRKGSRLGPVLAFLVATPATSISALIVTYQLLGLKVAVFIFFAVIFMGLSIGIMGNKIPFIKPCPTNRMDSGSPIDGKSEDRCSIKDAGLNKVPNLLSLASPIEHPDSSLPSVDLPESVPLVRQGLIIPQACLHCNQVEPYTPKNSFSQRIKSIFKFAFWDLPKEIGLEIILGVVLAVLVATFVPLGLWIKQNLSGFFGYIFALVFGLIMYICSTGTVPLVDALIKQGLNPGAGITLLLVGPITSYGTILVLRKEFGLKIVSFYLFVISLESLFLGYLFFLI